MSLRQLIAAAVVLVSPHAAAAQGGSVDPQCNAGGFVQLAAQDACQKAVDIFEFVAPQLGISIVGGNAVLGEAGTLRGLGHFSVGVRANLVAGRIPQLDHVTAGTGGVVSSDYPVATQLVGLPAVDVAIGLFPGILLPGTRGLGVDLVLNIAWLPSITGSEFSVSGGSARFGLGGRLSVLEESIVTPAVTFTYLRRDLPQLDAVATPGSDRLELNDLRVETGSWRLLIGKHLGSLELTAGAGQDRYDASTAISVRVVRLGLPVDAGPLGVGQKLTRTNAFLGISLDVPLLRFGVELGRVSGGNLATFNTFGGSRADDPLIYGSVGVRIHR
jgi:hypothetical protein